LTIKPVLLNRGDLFVFQVIIAAYNGLTEDFKIKGTQVYEYQERKPLVIKSWFMVGMAVTVFCTSYLFVIWRHLPLVYAALAMFAAIVCMLSVGVWSLCSLQSRAFKRWTAVGLDEGPKRVG